ncbi:MAG: flagellar biosynthetic protein FliR [Planctomycetota bacterium]
MMDLSTSPPLWLSQITYTLLLVTVRLGGLAAFLPGLSSRWLSLRLRVVFVLSVALLITPTLPRWNHDTTPAALIVPLAWELLVGMALGLTVRISLLGMQVAGQWIGQITGLSLGNTLAPEGDADGSSLSQLFHGLALTIFFGSGGHRHSIAAVVESFHDLPLGEPRVPTMLVTGLIESLALSCELAIRISLPVVAATTASLVVIGLIGRVLPQINSFVIGATANTLLLFWLVIGCLCGVGCLFEEHLARSGKILHETLIDAPQHPGRFDHDVRAAQGELKIYE